ncbi:zinc ribbon domain-containing protein [Turicibacter sanguinis]|uniref:zinc ribbon domain-containing protein n=1 Tax=Turicibacter sanguinis TaxID=154288 RepID=UPI0012BBA3BE|nr:zinc ribbon domain-containing protein [Turicibacter sanguinis]
MRQEIRKYPDGWGDIHLLSRLLFCADCGGKLYVHRTNNGKRIAQFTCDQYSKTPVGTRRKTQHRVNADVVMTLIKETLKEIVKFSQEDEEEFLRTVKATIESQQSTEICGRKLRLTTIKSRLDELEMLMCKIYEDNTLGKLPDKRYQMLDAQCIRAGKP